MANEILKNIITPINAAASQQSTLLVTTLQGTKKQYITTNTSLSHLTHKLDVMTGKYHGTAQSSLSINSDNKKELFYLNQNINRQLDYLIKLNQNIKDLTTAVTQNSAQNPDDSVHRTDETIPGCLEIFPLRQHHLQRASEPPPANANNHASDNYPQIRLLSPSPIQRFPTSTTTTTQHHARKSIQRSLNYTHHTPCRLGPHRR